MLLIGLYYFLIQLVYFEVDIHCVHVSNYIKIIGLETTSILLRVSACIRTSWFATAVANWFVASQGGHMSILAGSLVVSSRHWNEIIFGKDRLALGGLDHILTDTQTSIGE